MSSNFKPTPTARELIAAKQANVPAPAYDKPLAAARVEYNNNYRSRYLDEVAPASIAGRLVKFKDSTFVTHDDGQALPSAAEYIALCDETLIGWKRFNGTGEQPTVHMGLWADNFEPPSRESLGELDESQWDTGLNGQPEDPWIHEMDLVLQDTKTAELFTFSTASRSGRTAVVNLLRHYDRMVRRGRDELPTVRLAVGSAKNRKLGITYSVPVFVVLGSAPRGGAAKSNGSLVGPSDPINF